MFFVRLYTHANNRGTIVPGWGGVPGFILCTKPMRTSMKKLCPNNEWSPVEGVYMGTCVGVFFCFF